MSGKETIDCVVCLWGKSLSKPSCLVHLTIFDISLLQSAQTYLFSSSSSCEKSHFSFMKRRRKLPLCQCSVFFFLLQISTVCIRMCEKSLFIKNSLLSFPPFWIPSFSFSGSSLFGDLRRGGYLRSLRPVGSKPFSH